MMEVNLTYILNKVGESLPTPMDSETKTLFSRLVGIIQKQNFALSFLAHSQDQKTMAETMTNEVIKWRLEVEKPQDENPFPDKAP